MKFLSNNWAVLSGLLRHVLTTAGGALATYGIVEESQVEPLVGAVMVIAGVALSAIDKNNRG
jgi:hypothetical protein